MLQSKQIQRKCYLVQLTAVDAQQRRVTSPAAVRRVVVNLTERTVVSHTHTQKKKGKRKTCFKKDILLIGSTNPIKRNTQFLLCKR